jgi:hypothetical protein
MMQDDAAATNSPTVSPALLPELQPEEQEVYGEEYEQDIDDDDDEQNINDEEDEGDEQYEDEGEYEEEKYKHAEEEKEEGQYEKEEEEHEEEPPMIETISEEEEALIDDYEDSDVESSSPSSQMETSSGDELMEDDENSALETTSTMVPAYTFLCDTAPPHAQPFEPIIMMANARTGSNLFFSFLGRLALFNMDLLPLYEIFGNDSRLLAQLLNNIVEQIATGCQWEDFSYNRTATDPEQVFAALATSSDSTQQRIMEELQHVFTHRLEDPAPFLEFLHRIPSTMPRAYYALKVFPFHVLDLMKMTVTDFLALFESMPETQYILLWRRNMLEIFVSFKIALTRQGWVNVASTQDNAVQVDRTELEWFVQRLADFYQQAGDYLSTKSCHIFEYDQDLSNATQQLSTVQRIQTEVLQLALNEEQVQMVVEKAGTTKQAVVPLSQQIVNWEEVQEWGYSESSLDWPNLFP